MTVCTLESKSSEAAGPALMWKLEMPLTSRWSCLEVPPDVATALKSAATKTHSHTHNETYNMITEVLCLFKSRLCLSLSLFCQPLSQILLQKPIVMRADSSPLYFTERRDTLEPSVFILSTNQAFRGHVQPNVDKLEDTI